MLTAGDQTVVWGHFSSWKLQGSSARTQAISLDYQLEAYFASRIIINAPHVLTHNRRSILYKEEPKAISNMLLLYDYSSCPVFLQFDWLIIGRIIYLLTGHPVCTEKYQARSHIVRTERNEFISLLTGYKIHV